MTEWIIKEHPDFFRDLDKLGKRELKIFYNKKEKIKKNPNRLKHLSGGKNCYREPINDNIRLIYLIENNIVWLLTIGPHKKAYRKYIKRIHNLKKKL